MFQQEVNVAVHLKTNSMQEQNDKLIAEISLVILAETGHKLSMDEIKSLAKAIIKIK